MVVSDDAEGVGGVGECHEYSETLAGDSWILKPGREGVSQSWAGPGLPAGSCLLHCSIGRTAPFRTAIRLTERGRSVESRSMHTVYGPTSEGSAGCRRRSPCLLGRAVSSSSVMGPLSKRTGESSVCAGHWSQAVQIGIAACRERVGQCV